MAKRSSRGRASGAAASRTSKKTAKGGQPKKAPVGRRKKKKKARVSKKVFKKKARRSASPVAGGMLTTWDATTRTSVARSPQTNRQILAQLLGGDWPDDTELKDLGYDDFPSKAALAAALRARGVPVSPAAIMACDTVGCVRLEMKRVRPEGRRGA